MDGTDGTDEPHPRTASFVDRVRAEHGFEPDVREFPEGTETAADAADAVGCPVAAIASSIVFVADGDAVVVITSGANRVDEDRLAEHLDASSVRTADPGEVRAATGYAIGGVPPLCHDTDVPVFLDDTLTDLDRVWAAAGTPDTVFPVTPDRLRAAAGAEVVSVATPR